MVISRVGQKNIDQAELEKLEELAKKGISDDELEEVISQYEDQEDKKVEARESFEMMREKYKREKAQEGFRSGVGGFKRAGD